MSGNPGSGVWRIDLDLDGDGQAEILLANSESSGKHGDMEWEVYRRVSGSQFRFIGSLIFSHVAFQVLQKPARVEALWFDDAHDLDASGHIVRSANLTTYLVAPAGITLNSTTPLQERDIQAKVAQIDAWRKATRLSVLIAVAGANGVFENPIWHDSASGKPVREVTSLEGLVVVR